MVVSTSNLVEIFIVREIYGGLSASVKLSKIQGAKLIISADAVGVHKNLVVGSSVARDPTQVSLKE